MSGASARLLPKDDLFLKLAIIPACLAVSSATTYFISFTNTVSDERGDPSHATVSYCFFTGAVIAVCLISFGRPATLRPFISPAFSRILRQTLPLILLLWSTIALLGSRLVTWIFLPYRIGRDLEALHLPESLRLEWEGAIDNALNAIPLSGDPKWLQMSLMLLTTSLTFFIWHRKWSHADHDEGVQLT